MVLPFKQLLINRFSEINWRVQNGKTGQIRQLWKNANSGRWNGKCLTLIGINDRLFRRLKLAAYSRIIAANTKFGNSILFSTTLGLLKNLCESGELFAEALFIIGGKLGCPADKAE